MSQSKHMFTIERRRTSVSCTLTCAVCVFAGACSESTTVLVTPRERANITTLAGALAWDHEEDFEVEGTHGVSFSETCKDKEVVIDGEPPDWRLEYETHEVKKDGDTHWEFHKTNDQHIRWHVCAHNCVFSCDTIKLHIAWRAVRVSAPSVREATANEPCQCYCQGAAWPPGSRACLGGQQKACADRPSGSGSHCGWDDRAPTCTGKEQCSE